MFASMGGMGGSTRSGSPGGNSSPPRTGDFDFLPNTARDHNRSSRWRQPVEPVRHCDVVADLLGDSVILHGSEPNRSNRRRCGLAMRYLSEDVRAYLDWNTNSIW